MKRHRRFFYWLVTVSVGLIVPLVLIEATVRIINPASLEAEHTELHYDYNHRLRPGSTTRAQVAREKFDVLLRVNTQGLAQVRDVMIPKPSGVYRILIIGDSFIQGLGQDKTLPAFVQTGLDPWRTDDGRQFEIINGGTQSYSPLLYAARYIHQYAQMQPDAVIIFPDLTDVYDDYARYKHLAEFVDDNLIRVRPSKGMVMVDQTKRMLHFDDVPLQSYKYLVTKLAYFRALNLSTNESKEDIFEHALDDETNPRPETLEAIRYSSANMKSFVNRLLSDGVHVSIMVYPHEGQIVPQFFDEAADRQVMLNRLFERSLELLGRDLGVSFVSFYDTMSHEVENGRQIYFSGDMHFNVDGLRALATSVTQTILAYSPESVGVAISPRQ